LNETTPDGYRSSRSTSEREEIGGLMSHAVDLEELGRYRGYQMGQVLNGINPGDLPFIQITRLQLTPIFGNAAWQRRFNIE
jgi:ABC-type uncharacterized transport system substrate-binding protein